MEAMEKIQTMIAVSWVADLPPTFVHVRIRQLLSGPLPFSITDEARDFGQCKSFLPLLTRFSRTPEARSRASGVRAPAMY